MLRAYDSPQQALSFVLSQVAHVEQYVYKIKYGALNYAQVVPIDTSANPWAKSVTYYSQDQVGKMQWFNHRAKDVPLVATQRSKFETEVHMGVIGYDYTLEEINQARLLGMSLDTDNAAAARRGYEEFVHSLAMVGDSTKGFEGLLTGSGVTRVDVPNGASTHPDWARKTPDEILLDVNTALVTQATGTLMTGMADTLLLPFSSLLDIGTRRLTDVAQVTIYEWIKANNAYTMQTGQPLTILGLNDLETAGSGGVKRMVTYRKSPEVVKMHIPMPLQFLAPQTKGLSIEVPGMARVGGVDWRLPKEARYSDGI